MIDREALSVSAINQAIKQHLESAPQFGYVIVQGEVSNLKEQHGVGHLYFTLKDDDSKISAVMFASSAKRMKTPFRDGEHIQVQARVTVYEKGGSYQLLVNYAEPLGIGALYQRFEQLKAKLSQRGWFDDIHKIDIPTYPMKIGVITAPTGAAVRDMIITWRRRWPMAKLIIYPCQVQGFGAAASIRDAIAAADQAGNDVLIVGRGGGSIEDLWAFNEEVVAEAIYHCITPIISGVGHESDTTIADYVADARAATPTAAIVRATPDYQQLRATLNERANTLVNRINQQITLKRREMDHYLNLRVLIDPTQWIHERQMAIDQMTFRVGTIMQQRTDALSAEVEHTNQHLSALMTTMVTTAKYQLSTLTNSVHQLSPRNVLARGYSVLRDSKGVVIASIKNIQLNDEITAIVNDGSIIAQVTGKE